MRHNVKKAKLNRKKDHRDLLLRNMATSLIAAGSIVTTEAKATAVQPYVERVISLASSKSEDREAIRYLKSELLTEEAQKKVLAELKAKYEGRKGGYTRISRIGVRPGDGAMKVELSLV